MSLSDYKCFSSQKLASPGGMNWQGAWNVLSVYQYGDVVEGPDGEGYVCIDLDGNIGSTPGTAPAVWQLLSSGTATAVTLGSAIGSGITTAEPTPNNFTVAANLTAANGSGIDLTPSGLNTSLALSTNLTAANGSGVSLTPSGLNTSLALSTNLTTANGCGIDLIPSGLNTSLGLATNLVAAVGSGISLIPSAVNTSVAISNAGVLSVTAGAGISVGGTPQNPTVALSNVYAYAATAGITQTITPANTAIALANFSTLQATAGFSLPVGGTTIAFPSTGTYRVLTRIVVTNIATTQTMIFYYRYNGVDVPTSSTYVSTLPSATATRTPVVMDAVFTASAVANLEVVAVAVTTAGQTLVNNVAVTNPPNTYTAPTGPAVVVEIYKLA